MINLGLNTKGQLVIHKSETNKNIFNGQYKYIDRHNKVWV